MSEKYNDDEQILEAQKKYVLLKNNEIKVKKRIIPIEREQLYAENLELKSKIKDLIEINTKIKTQLSINQKQKTNLFNIAEQQAFHPKIPQRSQSGNHKKLMPNQPNFTHINSLLNSQLTKQKQSIAFKKILRDHKMQNERLYNQNQKLKKTMKFTRMNQILAENKELLDESLRLKVKLTQFKELENQNLTQFMNQIENLRKKLAVEKDSQKKNGFELKKQQDANSELKQRLRQMQSKKIQAQKRLNKEIKQLKIDNAELRTKLIENTDSKSKQLERNDLKKEKVEMKKKIENLQKQIKKIRDDNQLANKKSTQRQQEMKKHYESQIRKVQNKGSAKRDGGKTQELQNKSQVKNSDVPEKSPTKQDKTRQYHSNSTHKEQKKVEKAEKVEAKQQPIKKTIQSTHKQNDTKMQKKYSQRQIQQLQLQSKQFQLNNKNPKNNKQQEKKKTIVQKNTVQSKKKQTENYQSDDTDKLLQSFQGGHISKQESKEYKVQNLVAHKQKESDDGEYEQIDFQDQDEEYYEEKAPKKQDKSSKKAKKSIHQAQPQTTKKAQKAQKSQKKKDKKQKSEKDLNKDKKSKKKIQAQKPQQQQDKKQQNQGGKAELKLIRDTLLYKFIAQKYTYNDFCNDIQNSQIKQFTIEEVMGILSQEPFLLGEQNIEHLLVYLFQTDQLTGEEKIATKTFMKKMKKFVGKAQQINEEQYDKKIQKLKEIVEKDENGSKKIQKKCKQFDNGQGTIQKEEFIAVMGLVNIKGDLLETALSQIAYISQDLDHLNYDFFLKRFTED